LALKNCLCTINILPPRYLPTADLISHPAASPSVVSGLGSDSRISS
jgi:hypothetical protein